MKIKIDGKIIGTVNNIQINYCDISQPFTSLDLKMNKAVFNKIHFENTFKNFHEYDHMDFSFERKDGSIWEVHNAWVKNYSWTTDEDAVTDEDTVIVDDVDFICESISMVNNKEELKGNEMKDETDKYDPEMINRFTAAISKVTWEPVGDECPECKNKTLEHSRGLFYGPWSGAIRCTSCTFTDSFINYIGNKSIIVEPINKNKNNE